MGILDRWKARTSRSRDHRGVAGARLYAVGDVHGRLDLLDRLLATIGDDVVKRPIDRVFLAFLGDLIDRGPASAQVVERLRTMAPFDAEKIFLMGNHEEFFLRVLDGEPGLAYDWLSFGGDACARSYGLDPYQLELLDEARIASRLRKAVPPEHVAFLESFADSFRFGDYLLVHAGIRPGVAIADQQAQDLRWIRHPFLVDNRDHGVMVVHGHSISDTVEMRSNRIGLDTGAYQTGILSAVAIDENERRFLSTAP